MVFVSGDGQLRAAGSELGGQTFHVAVEDHEYIISHIICKQLNEDTAKI